MCDYVVDPVWCEAGPTGPAHAHERVQGSHPPGTASGEPFERVLGRSVEQFAPALAALTDHEEMVLALVHPLVQVYTIPRTGQLAYVGHICNFRQKVSKFLASLPTMPADMPFVHVRPRKYRGNASGKALFKVDVHKLRAAFIWLKANNPYYYEVEWREDAAAAWSADDVEVGTVREADDEPGQAPPVTRACFIRWMEHAAREACAGDAGFAIGRRISEALEEEFAEFAPVTDSAAPPVEGGTDKWNAIRRLVAGVCHTSDFRMALALPQDVLVVAMAARDIVDFALPQTHDAHDKLQSLRTLDTDACPDELTVFRAELDAIMLELANEDPEVVQVGSTVAADPRDDFGAREDMLESLAAAAKRVADSGGHPEFAGEREEVETAAGPGAPTPSAQAETAAGPGTASPAAHAEIGAEPTMPAKGRKCKYPRVDPPDVEDEPGQAVREDTPGYIPKAFPKLFPHGTGDYHGDHAYLRRSLRFEEWGAVCHAVARWAVRAPHQVSILAPRHHAPRDGPGSATDVLPHAPGGRTLHLGIADGSGQAAQARAADVHRHSFDTGTNRREAEDATGT